jgi:flagellin
MLQRMRELAVQNTSGLYNTAQTTAMSTEFSALKTEVSASLGRATFNGVAVFGGGGNVAVDANGGTISVTAATVDISAADVGTVSTVDTAIGAVGTELGNIGALQSRLEKAANVSAAIEEAQWASYGRVMDADMARETARLTSAQIVQQAGASALAQANSIPQIALGLL